MSAQIRTPKHSAKEAPKQLSRLFLRFPEYIFIEHNEEHAENLSDLRRRFPNIVRRIKIIPEDANVYLLKWCRETDWNKMRAVVFLDPYGMQVEWATIEAMAGTKSIDLWVLFPLGVGVNRFL
jgi:three-Cys-motif partner protein